MNASAMVKAEVTFVKYYAPTDESISAILLQNTFGRGHPIIFETFRSVHFNQKIVS